MPGVGSILPRSRPTAPTAVGPGLGRTWGERVAQRVRSVSDGRGRLDPVAGIGRGLGATSVLPGPRIDPTGRTRPVTAVTATPNGTGVEGDVDDRSAAKPRADGTGLPRETQRARGHDRADRDLRDMMALAWDLRVHELEQALAPSPPLDDDAPSDHGQRQRRGLARVRAAATRRAVQEIATLSRLDDGCCEECEREIPRELLRAAPAGRLCISRLAGRSARGRGDDDEQ